jgi:hypothetical protein
VNGKLTFDELSAKIAEMKPPISALINNQGHGYHFHGLKPSVSFSPDLCGVGLNHTNQPQRYKRSRFHDSEDVDIAFSRKEFREAQFNDEGGVLLVLIKCITFWCLLEVKL